MNDLRGRVAIVTGASSGLGARVATVLAEAGADVLAAGRRLDRLEELAAANPTIHAVKADVTDGEERGKLVAEAVDGFGRLDVLVNNAGAGSGGPAEQADLEVFRTVLR